jgi:hypothetical protein
MFYKGFAKLLMTVVTAALECLKSINGRPPIPIFCCLSQHMQPMMRAFSATRG